LQDTQKFTQLWDFWFENKPSGNLADNLSWVTRLGESSPMGWLFPEGSVFENSRNFMAIFSHGRNNIPTYFDRNRVGLHFGQYFHKLIWSP
jgi:hypothetical protein